MATQTPIVFYDIATARPLRTMAPNPWKTRFALNFKRVPYKTQWVQIPHIHGLREELGVPANRTHGDGTPYHTLPVISDSKTGAKVGDSFEIALYLDKANPDGPQLFRPNTIGLTAAFNNHVDNLFTKFVAVCSGMPFDPEYIEEIHAIFAKRAGVKSFDQLSVTDEQREGLFVAFEIALGELAKAYYHTGGTTDNFFRAEGTGKEQAQRPPVGREQASCFLDGDGPAYADFIVGAWLKFMQACLKPEDWSRVRSWQGGFWGRLVDALEVWAEIK